MTYKRLEETTFAWPAIRDDLMSLNQAQFEALFAGLDWRKVKALSARPPATAECLVRPFGQAVACRSQS